MEGGQGGLGLTLTRERGRPARMCSRGGPACPPAMGKYAGLPLNGETSEVLKTSEVFGSMGVLLGPISCNAHIGAGESASCREAM